MPSVYTGCYFPAPPALQKINHPCYARLYLEPMIPSSIIEQIADRCDIVDVIGAEITLTKKGANHVACCPFHNENTPSFIVSPRRNTFKCFSCGIGGDAITFLREYKGYTFNQAVKELAKRYDIDIEEQEETPEQTQQRIAKESMLSACKIAMDFYAACINDDSDDAKAAYKYAQNRWGEDIIKDRNLGYAPGGCALTDFLTSKGHNKKYFFDVGLLKERKDGSICDVLFNRLVIPIRDRLGRYISFTARAFGDVQPKYINSPTSIIYHKGSTLFGIDTAAREAAKTETVYAVEGAPDLLRMLSIGADNTLAPLGTAWTEDQFKIVHRLGARLCFIPDIDKPNGSGSFGAGIDAVIKNGKLAIKFGLTVTVKEITPTDGGKKADPDTFITSRKILDSIEEQDFLAWLAAKRETTITNAADKAETINEIAPLLTCVPDKVKERLYIKQISKILNVPQTILSSSVNEARAKQQQGKVTESRLLDQQLYKKYGFFERNNCYFSLASDGDDKQWSNFIMEPLFHIRDQVNPKRLYRITNENGQKEIIELKQKELISLSDFKCRTEGVGNFIWEGSEKDLNKLKRVLYERTESAKEITQLGWNRDGFYAFGNGILYNTTWYPAEELGIVRLTGLGNYYLPGASAIYKGDFDLFQFERKFVHLDMADFSLLDFTTALIKVFGDNAKIGISYLLATLFKDVVAALTKNFPILNLFGPKGSGKSELGHSLMSFFIIKNSPGNITNATDAALADTISQSSNALVHLDEYKNTIELTRREFLKGLYDGVGRTRMNMDRDKKREMTRVDCGVVLSGQEMPTIDIALFSRLLFCRFDRTEFSVQEKKAFGELVEMRDKGCSHLTIEILKHRKKFEAYFSGNYKSVMDDFLTALSGEVIEDRIYRNWVTVLASLRTLEGVLELPFGYAEMLRICAKSASMQNAETRTNNEIGVFWSTVDYLHQSGEIFYDSDYRIKYMRTFRGKGMTEDIVFTEARPVLLLCTKRVFMLFKQNAKNVGDAKVSLDSLRYYLENSKEYLGTKNAVRFKNSANRADSTVVATTSAGTKEVVATSRTDWALCFDYKMIAENFGINLELEYGAFDGQTD